ncbi:hypothetical protein Bca4012_038002 [Brassica carinata]
MARFLYAQLNNDACVIIIQDLMCTVRLHVLFERDMIKINTTAMESNKLAWLNNQHIDSLIFSYE